jgi:hypothetical protein
MGPIEEAAKLGTDKYYAEHEARRQPMGDLEKLNALIQGKGNIDLNNRDVYLHPGRENDFSSLESISVGVDGGKVMLIPKVVGGKMLDNQQAVDHMRKTGENLGVFDDEEAAKNHAINLERRQNAYYGTTPEGKSILDRAYQLRKKPNP